VGIKRSGLKAFGSLQVLRCRCKTKGRDNRDVAALDGMSRNGVRFTGGTHDDKRWRVEPDHLIAGLAGLTRARCRRAVSTGGQEGCPEIFRVIDPRSRDRRSRGDLRT